MVVFTDQTWQIIIRGVVQSVGFRPTVSRVATRLDLHGTVRNLGNLGVEILLNTDQNGVEDFITELEEDLPELAEIFHIEMMKVVHEKFDNFTIISSRNTSHSVSISPLPPDIPICDKCRDEILNSGRRSDYAFTSCTNCGPRYSVIDSLPYDRERTSFADFPLCPECLSEYEDPDDRRYHAQTTCCPDCGPSYLLYSVSEDNTADPIGHIRPSAQLDAIAKILTEDKIIALQGLGGTHYVVNALSASVATLRHRKRKQSDKPFAVMVSSIDVAKKYCIVTKETEKLLLSQRRPIVILPIKEDFIPKFKDVSPGLHTLGVMLPYAGIHHLLFDRLEIDILVMTSANPPKVPMPISKLTIIEQTKSVADMIIVHNREIKQRIDDSVIRPYPNDNKLLRRARGYTPTPVFLDYVQSNISILGLGAEQVNTAAILQDDYLVMTQHIGDLTTIEAVEFQRHAIDHLLELYQLSPQMIVLDLHPQYLTRSEVARYYSGTTKVIELQHHAAHAYSLLADTNADPEGIYLIWSCDGYGYGSDGQAWGGELISIQAENWQRVTSLQPVNYSGGDRNAKYPDRMLAIMLNAIGKDPVEYFTSHQSVFEYQSELNVLLNQISQNKLVTTSLGRLLDAISAMLDITHLRTYRGEPAIKLEDFALTADTDIPISTFIDDKKIDNLQLFARALELIEEDNNIEDIAHWVLQSIGQSMGKLAISLGPHADGIGFTGGVAYNEIIEQSMKTEIENAGIEFLTHNRIPPGDGGISAGQVYYGGLLL